MLPEVKKVKLEKQNFPASWQTVIFRNYGYVPTDRIAKVLGCTEEIVEQEAARLGLCNTHYDPKWEEKGYITLIRSNWYLLSYEQLMLLLDLTRERLEYILQHDDFLWVKLGEHKPECAPVRYSELTRQQIEQTEALAQTVNRHRQAGAEKPFDFLEYETKESSPLRGQNRRIVHGYLSPCGDPFLTDSEEYLPDPLLKAYRDQGVNGIWIHGVLSTLSYYPFDESLCRGFEKRRKELKRLVARCEAYGIKVYLYFNEPRALPVENFGRFAHLMGRTEKGFGTLCLEKPETQTYLYEAVKDLMSDVKKLGGIITITMSENMTHCNYWPHTNCPVCKHIPPQESAAKVNNIIAKAIRDSGSYGELIANLWGWSPFTHWSLQQALEGVTLLDKDISVMCVSEYDLAIQKGGVSSKIIDYSIANPGPSELTKETLGKAKNEGHRVYAKIQVNNSWECSAVPYLPVFDLVYTHLKNLTAIGVKDYMLTWTLGGYPSPMLRLVADYSEDPEGFSLDRWYESVFPGNGAQIRKAVESFCKGFCEYPFSIDSLYYSPKTLGPANLWTLEQQEKQSTMVCYAFDDYEKWTKPYPVEVYLSQMEKLLAGWEQGIALLDAVNDPAAEEMKTYAKAACCHFKTDYLQTKFSYLKKDAAGNREGLLEILQQEQRNTQSLLQLYYGDGRVGFEASNQYYYTERSLLEKLCNLQLLQRMI